MSVNMIAKGNLKQIFYAKNMRCLVAQLKLLRRTVTSMTMQSKVNSTPVLHQSSPILHDPNLPLPGNVGVDLKSLDVKNSPVQASKYESLASALLQLENETFRKHQVLSQFIAEKMEEGDVVQDIATSVQESVGGKVECRIQSCPLSLKKDFEKLFSNFPELSENMTVLTISQETKNDMATWSEEVEEERDVLTGVFVESAKDICEKIKEGGYWADFIDPSSGHAYYSKHRNEVLTETDDRFNQLGFEVEDLGCCKVLLHKYWKSNVFVGVIFTNAPVESHVFDNM